MRNLLRIAALMTACVTALSNAVVVSAGTADNVQTAVTDTTDSMAMAKQLGIVADNVDRGAAVTRENACSMLVRFYRASTGGAGITINNGPFHDCNTNEVVFCYENGIISGIGDATFAPDYFVSREEMCTILVNAVKACNVNVIYPQKDYTSAFKDAASISDEHKSTINYLTGIGIVKGYEGFFYPKAYVTYDQLVSMLVETYYQLMLSKISINGIRLSIGDSDEKIIKSFGEPDYKFSDTLSGTEIWEYKKDYRNFFYIGLRDKTVSEIFTNSSQFTYRGISSGDSVDGVSFGVRANVSNNKAVYNDGYGIVEIGAFPNDNLISYVYAASDDINLRHNINYTTVKNDATLLYDIINAERAKHELGSFIINAKAVSAANVHSMSMGYWEYSDYKNRDGTTPFDRLNSRDLNYIMASENIAQVKGTVVDVYTKWMSSSGSRSNLMTDYMDNIGIGIGVNEKKGTAYVVMDFLKLK